MIHHVGELPLWTGEYKDQSLEKSTLAWLLPLQLKGTKSILVLFDGAHPDARKNGHIPWNYTEQLKERGFEARLERCDANVLNDIRHGIRKDDETVSIEKESIYKSDFLEILNQAIRMGASDIHIEARKDRADVRLSLPGGKMKIKEMTSGYAVSMIGALYNTYFDRTSTDTHFRDMAAQKARAEFETPYGAAELRIQTVPVWPQGGMDMVARILTVRKSTVEPPKTLEQLGYLPFDVKNIRLGIANANGLNLWLGVVNSGKSTSIVNVLIAMQLAADGLLKIVSIEDPPETQIPRASQVPLEALMRSLAAQGKEGDLENQSYPEGIRISLRMDIDRLFIGEIRSAEMMLPLTNVIRSGHGTFATLHAGSAVEGVGRLANLGMDVWDMASPSFLNLLVYQKLVGELCPHCRLPYEGMPEPLQGHEQEILDWCGDHLAEIGIEAPRFYRRNPEGCPSCHGGVHRRLLIAETMLLDDALRQSIPDRNLINLRNAWIENGGRPIAHHGLLRFAAGQVDMNDLLTRGNVRWADIVSWVQRPSGSAS